MKRILYLSGVLILCLLFSSYILSKQTKRQNNLNTRYVNQINRLQRRIDRHEVYLSKKDIKVVRSADTPSPGVQQNIKILKTTFSTLTTFDSYSDYQSNLKKAEKTIKDKKFMNDYFVTPLNQIKATKIKMLTKNVNVTPTDKDGVYLVLVDAIPYYSKSDLYQTNKLSLISKMYTVTTVGNKVSHVEVKEIIKTN